MKKTISLLLAAILVLGLCACGGSNAEGGTDQTAQVGGLQVGFAREIVMPDGKPELDGTESGRIMTAFLDYLTVTCVAVKGDNGEVVLLYTMDRKDSNESWTAPMRTAISKGTGIAEDHIMLAATHTHSAAKFAGWNGAEKYKQDFQAALVKVGQDAMADLTPSEMYYGSTQAEGLVFVRHYKLIDGTVTSSGVGAGDANIVGHAAEPDEELQIIRFDRGEGKKEVILMSFNSHPTWYGGVTETEMSADFPAPTREYIESKGDYLVAYFTGDAGNQGPVTKYMPEIADAPKDYKEHGQRLGQCLLDALPTLTKAEGEDVTLVGQQFPCETNKEKLDMLAQAKEVVNVHDTQGREAGLALAAQYGMYQHLEAKAIIARANMPDITEVWMNVMSIGNNVSLAFMPYEMFSESGAYLRANTPYDMTFLSSCSNGSEGYLPSKAACEYGCYEYYTTRLAVGSAELLVDEYINMLTEMKNAA